MHEQSETVRTQNGRWQNVYGRDVRRTPGVTANPGDPLPPLFPFEQTDYGTEEDAVAAAKKRSEQFGRRVDEGQQRHGGFRRLLEGR